MKKIYALFMTLCLIISATATPLAGVAKKSYPLYQPQVVKAELAPSMHKAPAATQGLQYDAEAGELIRYYNETDQIAIDANYLAQGNLYIDIMAGDKSDYLTLLLFVEDTVEGAIIPEGTYPITSEPAYNTALASQGYSATQGVIPCAYYPLVEQGGTLYINTPMYFMQSGNIVVEHVNGAPKITINAVNSNNVPMTIVFEIGGKSEKVEVKTPLKYDATAADGALDYTYGEDAVAETTDKGFYGMLDVADATSMLALLFVYPEGVADAETTIPAGTYTISDSQAAGTVLASSGVSNTGGVGYSFYAKTNAQGQLVPPLYFPVEGTVEVTKVDGKLKVEVNALNSNDVPVHVVYDATSAEPEYALEETVEISNLTTDILTVGEATYLQLTGRNDMLDSDVQLFLNNYTGEDKEYEVNVENSLMTFGGIELTVVEGKIAQATDPEKGQVYTGRVIASAEEEGEVMLVALDLIMYAAPAVELEIIDAVASVDEAGRLVLTAEWTDTVSMVTYPVSIAVAGYNEADLDEDGFEEYEGAQVSEIQIGDDDNWFDFAVANAVAIFKEGNAVTIEAEYTSGNTGATYYVYAEGEMQGGEDPDYMLLEDNITNLVIDLESMAIIGGPSTMWQVEVYLGLAEDDNMDGQWSLSPESSVAIMGLDARFIDGYVYDIDANAPAAKAVLHVEDNGSFYEIKLDMTSTPQEAIVVVVEDATVQIDTIPLFGDQVDYALKMTADWTYAEDGVTYPVLVEVPVYYPEATEPSEMTCTVTIGEDDYDPWLGFGEGTLTITTVDGVVTAKGIVANPYTGVAFDVTVSGKLPQGPGTGVDDINTTVAPTKVMKNGQLIIIKDGVEYSAQGAVVK